MTEATARLMLTSVLRHPVATAPRVTTASVTTTASARLVSREQSVKSTSTSVHPILARTEDRVWISSMSSPASVRLELPVTCAKRTPTTATWVLATTEERVSTVLEASSAHVLLVKKTSHDVCKHYDEICTMPSHVSCFFLQDLSVRDVRATSMNA